MTRKTIFNVPGQTMTRKTIFNVPKYYFESLPESKTHSGMSVRNQLYTAEMDLHVRKRTFKVLKPTIIVYMFFLGSLMISYLTFRL